MITVSLATGLALLTTGLGLGAAYVELPEGASFKGDPKVLWSMLVWAIYSVLLLLHWKFDQRGHRYAWSAIVAFGFVILTFWGRTYSREFITPPRKRCRLLSQA